MKLSRTQIDFFLKGIAEFMAVSAVAATEGDTKAAATLAKRWNRNLAGFTTDLQTYADVQLLILKLGDSFCDALPNEPDDEKGPPS